MIALKAAALYSMIFLTACDRPLHATETAPTPQAVEEPPPAPMAPEHETDAHETHAHAHVAQANTGADEASAVYACPMHPEVTSPEPGRCPECGMNLVLRKP